MGYESELKADERAVEQEWRSPRPVGDVIIDEDILEWQKQKQKYEEDDWREFEWADYSRVLKNMIEQTGGSVL